MSDNEKHPSTHSVFAANSRIKGVATAVFATLVASLISWGASKHIENDREIKVIGERIQTSNQVLASQIESTNKRLELMQTSVYRRLDLNESLLNEVMLVFLSVQGKSTQAIGKARSREQRKQKQLRKAIEQNEQ